MAQYTRNILKVFAQCTGDEVQHGLNWYSDAKKEAQNIADTHRWGYAWNEVGQSWDLTDAKA